MPAYPSADALLADARLRLDHFDEDLGVLVVEGPDDKRLFSRFSDRREQVIAAGGRRLLLSGYQRMTDMGVSDVAFVTDCDYEVRLGELRAGQPGLIITTYADVEADLFEGNGLRDLLGELVPHANDSDEQLNRLEADVTQKAVALAEPLGRMRFVGRQAGFKIRTDVRFGRHRTPGSGEVDVAKLIRTVTQTSPDCPLSPAELAARISAVDGGYELCNGHDLVAAVAQVLRDDYSVRDQDPDSIARLLRHGVAIDVMTNWSVALRLRAWARDVGLTILS